jgi:rod shape determining protein RodA
MALSGFRGVGQDRYVAKLWRVNWAVIVLVTALAAIGSMTLYSVAGGSAQPWAERHTLRFVAILAVVLVMAVLNPAIWRALAYPVYALAVLLLALVPWIGIEALGAKRWIGVGGMTFQPSELMKVALVAALARYYQWLADDRLSRPLFVLIPLAMILVPVLLTLRQPDLGSALLFASIGLALMFFAGVSLFYFIAGGGAVLAALPFIWANLHDYQRRRVETFLNPESDPLGAGYHISQSKIAIGAGGVSGKGYMQGTQSQLDFVPETHTDFIAAIIGEEWGFAGLVTVLGLFAVLLLLMSAMAWRCQNRFGQLLIIGSAISFFLYVFINLAMITGLVPVVGVPLPLVSYGGTSMTTLMLGLGLAMSAHVHGAQRARRGELGAAF